MCLNLLWMLSFLYLFLVFRIWLYLEWASIIMRISFPDTPSTSISTEGKGWLSFHSFGKALLRSVKSTHAHSPLSVRFLDQHWIGQPLGCGLLWGVSGLPPVQLSIFLPLELSSFILPVRKRDPYSTRVPQGSDLPGMCNVIIRMWFKTKIDFDLISVDLYFS